MMADPRDILDLGIDFGRINSYEDYEALWQRMAPVKATMIEKYETCRHALQDTFIYRNHYDRPAGICPALHHVLQLYVLRASLGFPSWDENPQRYQIHCPDKNGTVWTLQRATEKRPAENPSKK
jgi:uncharacterized repeat protein (TIGR04076 family)